MPRKKKPVSKTQAAKTANGRRTKRFLAAALVFLGISFFTVYGIVHWLERQLLTTDNWVEMVTPIPKDSTVSLALANYSVDKLFYSIDLEQKITQALPDKAAFIAPALTERVNTRATQLAQNVIQSDQFQGVWVAANRQAHQRLMDAARQDSSENNQQPRTNFGLKLQGLLDNVRDRLGVSSQTLFAQRDTAANFASDANFAVDLKLKINTFKRYVQTADFLNGVLLLASLACLVSALVLSGAKSKLLLIILACLSVLSLLQLIGVRVLRPEILNQIENASYRPAIGIIYDHLLASFKAAATSVFIASTAFFSLLYIAKRSAVKKNRFIIRTSAAVSGTAIWRSMLRSRLFVWEYRRRFIGLGAFVILAVMAFALDVDWVDLVRAVLIIIIYACLVILFAGPLQATVANQKK